MSTSRHPSILNLILLLAFVVRLAYVLAQDHRAAYTDQGGDSAWFLANGYALATGRNPDNYPVDLAYLPTPPVYLLFIGFWQAFLPPETAVIAVRVVQCLLGAATCYLAYRLAIALRGDVRHGLLTAFVLAVSPAFVIESAQIATEILYIFLVTLGLCLYVEHIRTSFPLGETESEVKFALWREAGIAALLGVATLTRAVLLLFPVALGLHLLLVYGWRVGLKRASLLLLVYSAVVSTWTVYNLVRYNRLVIGAEGFAAFLYFGASESGWQGREEIDQAIPGDTAEQTRQEQLVESASEIIGRDPLGYLRRRVTELASAHLQPHGTIFFSGASLKDLAADWLRNDRTVTGLLRLTQTDSFWPKLAIWLFHLAGLGAGVVGMWLCRRQWHVALPLALFIGYTAIVHFVLTAIPRYIFPTELFWWVFAAVALVALWDRLRWRRTLPEMTAGIEGG